MTNEIWDIKRGIKARLEGIPGLRVITFEPEDWRDFPVAVIRTESRSAARAEVKGSRFEAEFVVTVMAGGSKRSESYDALDAYIATDGEMSVEAAIAGDRTLGGAADWAHPAGVENIRVARMGGGRYVAADFRISVERQTAPSRPAAIEASATLSNELDGANRNYFDIVNITGAHGALAQIKIQDPSGTWSGSGNIWIGKRSLERRAGKLFFQAESGAIARGETIFEDGGAIWSGSVQPMSGASGGKYARMAWTKAGRYTTARSSLCAAMYAPG